MRDSKYQRMQPFPNTARREALRDTQGPARNMQLKRAQVQHCHTASLDTESVDLLFGCCRKEMRLCSQRHSSWSQSESMRVSLNQRGSSFYVEVVFKSGKW